MKIKHSEPYAPLRKQAYPDYGSQLDAILKLAAALKSQGFSMPQDTLEWIESCQAVKDKYPKN